MQAIDDLVSASGASVALLLNLSGGKDSTRMLGFIRQHFPTVKTYAVMADTGFEHVKPVPAVDWCRQLAAGFGLPLTVVRNPNKTYVVMVRRRGMFPSAQFRQCTSDLKRGPIQKFLRTLPEKVVINCMADVLQKAGFRVAVLRSTVATDKREAWYEKQLKEGVEVVICHPRLVETGLDLLAFPTLYFYETGYSLHTLRQASRRSWRIGQHLPVRVKFLAYSGIMQETCIRHMGKKMLVALMMEGKFSGEGLQSLDAKDEDPDSKVYVYRGGKRYSLELQK